MNVEFWQARIKITQVPAEPGSKITKDPKDKSELLIDKSWMCDPFLNNCVYGLNLTINNHFSWEFFLKADTEAEAIKVGHAFLTHLEAEYPGLTGEVYAKPITEQMLKQEFVIYELKFPRTPLKFSLIKKFIEIFRKNYGNLLEFFVFWQKDDSVDRMQRFKISTQELYKLKVYVRIVKNIRHDLEEQKYQLKGILEYLTMDVKNIKGERAKVKKAPMDMWYYILSSIPFYENNAGKHTGPQYRDIYEQIPKVERPAFVSPVSIDFTFPESILIPKANILQDENYDYLPVSEHDKNHIRIGNVIRNGIVESNNALIPVNSFAQSVFIGGVPGTGKTTLAEQISNEFYEKCLQIGMLYLNLGKGNQETFYKSDRIIKFGDPDFLVPYYVKGEYEEKSLQETASSLVSSLGLVDPVDRVLYAVMKGFQYHNGDLPNTLKRLFGGLKKWYRDKPYHEKYQTNILRAIDNRVLSLLSDPILAKALEYHPEQEVPEWFQEWRNGKKIYLDLSMCNIYAKRLITNAIFQMIRTLTPDLEAEKLQSIIMIDEAHQILEKTRESARKINHDDDVARAKLEEIFKVLLKEFRAKGLSFIIVDQTPSDLFDCVTKLPSLKILFRLGEHCSSRFTTNSLDLDFLSLLKDRQALVLNGVKGERYAIETVDLSRDRDIKRNKIKLEN